MAHLNFQIRWCGAVNEVQWLKYVIAVLSNESRGVIVDGSSKTLQIERVHGLLTFKGVAPVSSRGFGVL